MKNVWENYMRHQDTQTFLDSILNYLLAINKMLSETTANKVHNNVKSERLINTVNKTQPSKLQIASPNTVTIRH